MSNLPSFCVTLNVKTIGDLGITPNQFTIIKLLFEKKYNTLMAFMRTFDFSDDLANLLQKGILLKYQAGEHPATWLLNRQKTRQALELDNSPFWELFSLYPLKVPGRNGSSRYLHPADTDAKSTQALKKKYERIVGKSKAKHDEIVACLKAELQIQKASKSLQYMQNLDTWLNQRTWEKYKHALEEWATPSASTNHTSTSGNVGGYGTTII